MKKILILSYSHLSSDPRIIRQINALNQNYIVETCGYSAPNEKNIKFYPIYKMPSFSLFRKIKRFFQFIFRNFESYYWDNGKLNLVNELLKSNYNLIIANDIHTLPLALKIANKKSKVYFDAHEYHLLEFEDNFIWKIFHKPNMEYLCKKYIPMADAFSTVSKGIVDAYSKNVGITPFFLPNMASYHNLKPSLINDNQIKIIHHGAAIPSRKLELMIEMMAYTDERFSLDLMLVSSSKKYINKLKNLAKSHKNINFISAVKSSEICSFINKYSIGLYILQPSNFNNEYALPNKFFEFIQARLVIAISPSSEMEFYTKKYNLGVVADDFTPKSMAEKLNKLTKKDIEFYKSNVNEAAKLLSDEQNIEKIKDLAYSLVNIN
jgi:hypothetical protein